MKRYFVVEGPTDVVILRWLLDGMPEAQGTVEFKVAGGKHGAPPLARTLQLRTGCPVALIVDADRGDDDLISLESYFSLGSDEAPPTRVLVARPEIEAVLFAPQALKALIQREPTTEERVRGEYEPHKTLQKMLGDTGLEEALGRAGSAERQAAWKHEFCDQLRKFFQETQVVERDLGSLPNHPSVTVTVRQAAWRPGTLDLIVTKPTHIRSIRVRDDVARLLAGDSLDTWLLGLASKEAELELPPPLDAPFVPPAGLAPPNPLGASPVHPAGEPPADA
jgi:hypothetical protein